MTPLEMLKEFHTTFDAVRNDTPTLLDNQTNVLRQALLDEEVSELEEAVAAGDIVEIADALGDIVYIAYGTAVAHGIDLDAVLEEIHRSNMAKLVDGKVLRRDDGKVLKPEGWQPPNIARIIEK